MNARSVVLGASALSAVAMLYVGAYQARYVQHLVCPLLKKGCEAVADAPFARPFGIPDGFIAAGMYAVMIGLALIGARHGWARYALRVVAILAALANLQGVLDMHGMGAYCFYCLLTTAAAPVLVWACFVL